MFRSADRLKWTSHFLYILQEKWEIGHLLKRANMQANAEHKKTRVCTHCNLNA